MVIHNSLGNIAEIGMDQMPGPCTVHIGQTLASRGQGILVLVKAVDMATRTKSLQDRRRMTTATQGAVNVATSGHNRQLLEGLPKQDRQMGKLKDRGHRNG